MSIFRMVYNYVVNRLFFMHVTKDRECPNKYHALSEMKIKHFAKHIKVDELTPTTTSYN